jgi:predicted DNA-binding transcriptional regulator AlpA
MTSKLEDAFLSEKQACTKYSFTRQYFYKLRNEKKLPYYTVGRSVRYKVSEIEAIFTPHQISA